MAVDANPPPLAVLGARGAAATAGAAGIAHTARSRRGQVFAPPKARHKRVSGVARAAWLRAFLAPAHKPLTQGIDPGADLRRRRLRHLRTPADSTQLSVHRPMALA